MSDYVRDTGAGHIEGISLERLGRIVRGSWHIAGISRKRRRRIVRGSWHQEGTWRVRTWVRMVWQLRSGGGWCGDTRLLLSEENKPFSILV